MISFIQELDSNGRQLAEPIQVILNLGEILQASARMDGQIHILRIELRSGRTITLTNSDIDKYFRERSRFENQ